MSGFVSDLLVRVDVFFGSRFDIDVPSLCGFCKMES